ncbi:MAG: hypothetical protein HC915_17380 [Anaerolineae bacterium]|nr:hypothetical protein [Anaerolineae bacterium]
MQRAVHFICANLKANAGMLYCPPYNVAYYAHLGWQPIERRITYHQSTGAGVMDTTTEAHNAMVYPCGAFVFPDGDIDVRGKLW